MGFVNDVIVSSGQKMLKVNIEITDPCSTFFLLIWEKILANRVTNTEIPLFHIFSILD